MARQILVIRGGAIGDFILTLPAIAALRRAFPAARLEILGYPHVATLALCERLVDAIQPLESPSLAPFFSDAGALPPEWAQYFGSFDLIISYAFDPDKVFERNVRKCGNVQFVVAPHRPAEDEQRHAAEFFLQGIKHLGISVGDTVPQLQFATRLPSCRDVRIALHPGSGSQKKNWPVEKWSRLLKMLLDCGHKCLLIGGEAESEALPHLAKVHASPQLQCAFNLPLPDVARRLAACTAFVGHDSGISHLAAAVDLPLLLLWAKTNEKVWCPKGKYVRVLRGADKLSAIDPEDVLRELESFLAVVRQRGTD